MDIADTIAPKSDQMNAEDLLSGERTFTITEVRVADVPDQPVSVYLAEFPSNRPWKPSKTDRRVLVMAWGKESKNYAGHRLTLYRNPEVKWANEKVGGIRIKAMSHLPGNKRMAVALTETRGKRTPYVVEPLPDDAPTSPPLSETDVRIAALQTEWHKADPERKAAIEAEVATLRQPDADPALIETAFPKPS